MHSLHTQCLWLLRGLSLQIGCIITSFIMAAKGLYGVLCFAGALILELMLHCMSTTPQTALMSQC